MPVLVGNVHDEVLTLRDASGHPVSGATLFYFLTPPARTPCPLLRPGRPESPVGSGTYPLPLRRSRRWRTTSGSPPSGRRIFVANYRQTIWPVSAATPIEHVVGVPQEEMLWSILAGTPIAGAAFAIVAGSVVAPSGAHLRRPSWQSATPDRGSTSPAGRRRWRATGGASSRPRTRPRSSGLSWNTRRTRPGRPLPQPGIRSAPARCPGRTRCRPGPLAGRRRCEPMASLSIRRGDTRVWTLAFREFRAGHRKA